ncbi:MAPEG family protein [Mesorhizobium sp. M0053]|uniref:MAPEG family protein n=1 Tax=Mesorhizobium sp. M0053 TaxID=2956864 RepID=UPI00333A961D
MSASAYALTGFISWGLALLILMEVIRTYLVISGKVAANGFTPDNAAHSPFMQRLARAHANCIEGLPIFGGLLGVAIITGKTDITTPLAYTLLVARLVQSTIHLVSTSELAVSLRFTAFAVQMAIGAYWSLILLI